LEPTPNCTRIKERLNSNDRSAAVLHNHQNAFFGNGVLVHLKLDELEPLIANTEMAGLFVCVPAMEKDQPDIIKRLKRW
jgi:hypothetical protein